MSVTLLLALLLQGIAVVLLRHRLGKTWLRRPATWLVFASVVYDGVSAVALAFPSAAEADTFRNGIAPQFTDEADLLQSAAMLALAAGYLLTCPERAVRPATAGDRSLATRVLDWRILAALAAPVALLTYAGRGYNDGSASGAGTALSANLASTFFLALVVLAASGFLLRHGTRWFLPVLAVQSLVLAAAGERTPVIMDAVALALIALRCGLRIPGRQIAAAVALTALTGLALMGVRAQEGRELFYQDSGLGARATALAAGVHDLSGSVPGQPGLAAQLAERLDGTAFEAGILQARHLGQPLLSAGYVPGSLLLAVPSALMPSKLSHSGDMSVQQLETDDFGLQGTNFLPPLPAIYAGFLPWPWIVALLAGLGVAFGIGERWLYRRVTAARLVLLAAAVPAALAWDSGLPTMVLYMRSCAVLAVVAWQASRLLRSREMGNYESKSRTAAAARA